MMVTVEYLQSMLQDTLTWFTFNAAAKRSVPTGPISLPKRDSVASV